MRSGRIKKLLIFIIIVILLYCLDIGCPIKYITGISCPGCGITRAVVACAQLDFHQAFRCYPMIAVMPVLLILYIFSNRIPVIIRNIILYIIIAAIIGIYFVRMADCSDSIVVFHPEDNIIFRLFR